MTSRSSLKMQPLVFALFAILLSMQTICGQESCILQDNKEGICTEIKNCPNAHDGIKRNKFPITCRFEGNVPIICCEKQSKSRKMCEKWSEIKSDSFNSAGIGGFNSLAKEFPHMAALGYGSEKTRSWSCGGSLISEKFILTAAHCLNARNIGKPNIVRLGDLNLNRRTDNAKPKNYEIKRAIPHPDFKRPSKYNDLALLELGSAVIFHDYIKPACLQIEGKIPGGNWTATGWGLIGFNGPPANHLQKLPVRETPRKKCNGFYPNSTRGLESGVIDTQICAGEDRVDTCQGDSGGPLQIKKKFGLHVIIGVTSFGKPCGLTKAPGVYTRISKYVDWIESIVWP